MYVSPVRKFRAGETLFLHVFPLVLFYQSLPVISDETFFPQCLLLGSGETYCFCKKFFFLFFISSFSLGNETIGVGNCERNAYSGANSQPQA